MTWSPEQDVALMRVAEWLANPDKPFFYLAGYAGTGKTTLARHFAEGVDGPVFFGAYTGKAAHVLNQKGCKGAMTIHQMIYQSRENSRARLKELESTLAEVRQEILVELPQEDRQNAEWLEEYLSRQPSVQQLREDIAKERAGLARPAFTLNPLSVIRDASLVVLDECSMIDGQIGEDVLSFKKPVLVLGDPAQLPPVAGAGFFTEREPDFMLTEIHRQAKDNPIIWMANEVRQQRSLDIGSYGESRVIDQNKVDRDEILRADQILVGRNKTRHAYNNRIRELLHSPGDRYPIPGDKLVCLRNNHDIGLLNGELWWCDGVLAKWEDRVEMTVMAFDGDRREDVDVHSHHFLGKEQDLAWYERKEAQEFDYGYALTVHKSQGSQWPETFLIDESYCFRKDKYKWLYTGLTRAAEKTTVVQ